MTKSTMMKMSYTELDEYLDELGDRLTEEGNGYTFKKTAEYIMVEKRLIKMEKLGLD